MKPETNTTKIKRRTLLGDFIINEKVILTVIIMNAVVIFLMAFPSLEEHFTLINLDNIFVLYFLIEAIVKIRRLGFKDYWSINWNRFDFLIVVCTLPLLLARFIPIADSIHIITLFRLFRLMRLIRFFQFVPNLQHILVGLARAFKASIFVFVMLLFMNFVFAVLTTYLFRNSLPMYFGDPILSSFTIFQMFTLEGWNEIPQAISAQTDLSNFQINLAKFYFAMVVLLGGVFGMSIANAIFVDEMTMDNNSNLEKKIDSLESQIGRLEGLLIAMNTKTNEEIIKTSSEKEVE
ncbi:MAG: ion transporter [Saprospiraceae bacterium]